MDKVRRKGGKSQKREQGKTERGQVEGNGDKKKE